MRLDNKKLFVLYKSKGIEYLYHANTVRTSKTFMEENGLMSRGAVQSNGLIQTPQSSDLIDQQYGVWNDIFLDTADLHVEFKRQNHYGPVLFKISVDFINELDVDIWVTKNNPINWNPHMTTEQKYFTSVEELEEKWDSFQKQRKMTTLKNVNQPILFDYLEEIIVDNPKVKNNPSGIIYFDEAVKELKKAVQVNTSLKGKSTERECGYCYCRSNYLHEVSIPDLKRLFL